MITYLLILVPYVILFGSCIVLVGNYVDYKTKNNIKTNLKMYDYDQVVTFDVDDTLVMWPENDKKYPYNQSHAQPSEGSIQIQCPYSDGSYHLVPHQAHIDLMKKYKGRGFLVIVWSAGGVRWAQNVVDALGIHDYVDIVLTKPNRYVDDLNCEKWMGNRVYIK